MVDFADGFKAKNNGIRTTGNPRILLESLKILLPLAMIAGALSLHIYIRSQSIRIGYQLQQLKAEEEELLNNMKQLLLEERTLRDSNLLEALASRNPGVIVMPVQEAVVPDTLEKQDPVDLGTLALGNLTPSSELEKLAVFNR
jgi:cell division protein FtsL